jgi:hypothetical protein
MIASFLEYLVHELMGPPAVGRAGWHCPRCDRHEDKEWASFTVLPPKGKLPIKFRCHRCGWWGDEHDLMKHFNPRLNYPMCVSALIPVRDRYRRDYPNNCDVEHSTLGDIQQPSSTEGQLPIAQRGATPPLLAKALNGVSRPTKE